MWIGAELVDKDGNVFQVEHIYRETLENGSEKVYNFKVDDYHTYFVGRTMILVHNSKYDVGKYNEMPNEPGMDKHHVPQKAVMKNLIQITIQPLVLRSKSLKKDILSRDQEVSFPEAQKVSTVRLN